MEEAIGKVCNTLATFSNHLQTSCDALKLSVDRRPIPLDSASTTFTQCLNRRVASASSDLNLLESMTFETVSFEELLGHCNEVFKKNQNDLIALQSSSCFSEADIDIEDYDEYDEYDEQEEKSINASPQFYSSNCLSSSTHQFEDDPLLDDSLSFKNLGLSDLSLETIASDATNKLGIKESYQPDADKSEMIKGETEEYSIPYEEPKLIKVTKNDYENIPSYMRSLTSWEDLLIAVEKVNSYLKTKKSKTDVFQQDEISSLDLGHKARSYLLLLLKLNKLVVETIDGLICYRIIDSE